MHYLPTKMLTFRVPGRPKSGQVGVELALSWHLKGILKEVNFKMPIRSLWTGAGTISPPLLKALGAPWCGFGPLLSIMGYVVAVLSLVDPAWRNARSD